MLEQDDRTDPTDADLVLAARDGDREAFRVLVDRHLPKVRGFLSRLGARAADVDDLTQEVFVAVIRGFGGFRGEARFSTWVFGCAMNVWRNTRRGRPRTEDRAAEGSGPADAAPGPAEAAVLRENVDRFGHAMRRLPDRLREAFVLRYVEGLSGAEAAALLELPEGTVRRRAWEARERLREWLHDVLHVTEGSR